MSLLDRLQQQADASRLSAIAQAAEAPQAAPGALLGAAGDAGPVSVIPSTGISSPVTLAGNASTPPGGALVQGQGSGDWGDAGASAPPKGFVPLKEAAICPGGVSGCSDSGWAVVGDDPGTDGWSHLGDSLGLHWGLPEIPFIPPGYHWGVGSDDNHDCDLGLPGIPKGVCTACCSMGGCFPGACPSTKGACDPFNIFGGSCGPCQECGLFTGACEDLQTGTDCRCPGRDCGLCRECDAATGSCVPVTPPVGASCPPRRPEDPPAGCSCEEVCWQVGCRVFCEPRSSCTGYESQGDCEGSRTSSIGTPCGTCQSCEEDGDCVAIAGCGGGGGGCGDGWPTGTYNPNGWNVYTVTVTGARGGQWGTCATAAVATPITATLTVWGGGGGVIVDRGTTSERAAIIDGVFVSCGDRSTGEASTIRTAGNGLPPGSSAAQPTATLDTSGLVGDWGVSITVAPVSGTGASYPCSFAPTGSTNTYDPRPDGYNLYTFVVEYDEVDSWDCSVRRGSTQTESFSSRAKGVSVKVPPYTTYSGINSESPCTYSALDTSVSRMVLVRVTGNQGEGYSTNYYETGFNANRYQTNVRAYVQIRAGDSDHAVSYPYEIPGQVLPD